MISFFKIGNVAKRVRQRKKSSAAKPRIYCIAAIAIWYLHVSLVGALSAYQNASPEINILVTHQRNFFCFICHHGILLGFSVTDA